MGGAGRAEGAKRQLEEGHREFIHVHIRWLALASLFAGRHVTREQPRADGKEVERADLNGKDTGAGTESLGIGSRRETSKHSRHDVDESSGKFAVHRDREVPRETL